MSPKVHNHNGIYSSHEVVQTLAMATNLGMACMSIQGIAHFPHRYFHQLTEIATLACLNPKENRDRSYPIPRMSCGVLSPAENALKGMWTLTDTKC